MKAAYSYGFILLGLGLALILGSTSAWWPAVPDIVSFGLAITGFWLIGAGLTCLIFGKLSDYQDKVSLFVCRKITQLQNMGNGVFVPALAVFSVFVIPLAQAYASHSHKHLSIIFEFPSDVDFGAGRLDVEYLIDNDTDGATNISDFQLLQVNGTTKLLDKRGSSAFFCSDPYLIGSTITREAITTSDLPIITARGEDFSSTRIKAISAKSSDDPVSHSDFNVPAHSTLQVLVSYKADPYEYFQGKNTVTLCPYFKVFGSSVGRLRSICDGASRIYFPIDELPDRVSRMPSENYINYEHKSDAKGFAVIYSILKVPAVVEKGSDTCTSY